MLIKIVLFALVLYMVVNLFLAMRVMIKNDHKKRANEQIHWSQSAHVSHYCDCYLAGHKHRINYAKPSSLLRTYSGTALQHIHKQEEHDPHHIDKMPIPTACLKGEMVFRGKVPFKHTEKQHNKY